MLVAELSQRQRAPCFTIFYFFFIFFLIFGFIMFLLLFYILFFFAFSFVYFLISLFCDKPSQQRSSARQRRGLSLMRKMQILHSQTNLKAILSRRRLKQSVSRKMERQRGVVWCVGQASQRGVLSFSFLCISFSLITATLFLFCFLLYVLCAISEFPVVRPTHSLLFGFRFSSWLFIIM